MKATTIKPGFLVSLHTATRGGVRYQRVDLEEEKVEVPADETRVSSGDGELVIVQEKKRWETTRVVDDAAEHEMAGKVRSKARGFICSVCVNTPFGLLCPADREQELDAAIEKAHELAAQFNASAKHTNLALYAFKGRIASTDEEAARAIADEVKSLLEQMQAGIRKVDAAAIREAANKAKQMGAMLEAKQADAVAAAVEAARKAAREIVKRVENGGEDAKAVLKELNTSPVELARFAFLDLDEPTVAKVAALPAIDVNRAANLEVG